VKLETHLKSDDFFGVAKFNEATYTIVSGVKTNAITYDVKGKLTIKGNTHDLNCKLVVAPNGNDINVGGGFMFDRSAYDVRYGSDKFYDNLGNKMIKNEEIMTLNLQGKKQ
jgi:polyisoprenoid-binding protein YceI